MSIYINNNGAALLNPICDFDDFGNALAPNLLFVNDACCEDGVSMCGRIKDIRKEQDKKQFLEHLGFWFGK